MKRDAKTSEVKCTQRSARKLDRKQVLDLHGKGLTTLEIAQHQGVAPSTVWRFLDRSQPQMEALEQFKGGRADVLAELQAKSLDVQDRILDSLDDRVLATLTPYQKSGLLHALNVQAGTLYDKERLERGQSTTNVSLIAKMMGQAFDQVHKLEAKGKKSRTSHSVHEEGDKGKKDGKEEF